MTGSTNEIENTIVVANPGTGKTWEITNRVIQLLQSGVDAEDVICVTFTNKAADEMRSRIYKAVSEIPGLKEKALQLNISTIHRHAINALESRGETPTLTSDTILRYIIYRTFLDLGTFTYSTDYLTDSIVPKAEISIRYLKSFGIKPEAIHPARTVSIIDAKVGESGSKKLKRKEIERLVSDFIKVFQSYEKFKVSKNLMDYDDILNHFMSMKENGKFKYVLVDEFQDLNRVQVGIVEDLGRKRFFVGDRKQSIFGFQGGSLSSFHRYLKDSNFTKVGKSENHRSTNNILQYAKSYYLRNSMDPTYSEELENLRNPAKEMGEPVHLVRAETPESFSAVLLQRLLVENKAEDWDFAILARTNSQLEEISHFLDDLGITYSSTVKNRTDPAQTGEIITYVSGLVSDEPSVISKALRTPFSGLSIKEASEISAKAKAGETLMDLMPETFRKLRDLKFGTALIDQAFEGVVLPISTALGQGYFSSATAVLKASREYLEYFENYSLDGYLDFMRLASVTTESDLRKSRVNLLTVHKAKGLEFNTVIYVPTTPRSSLQFFDALTYSIISGAVGIDVEQDLLEEPLRIDFVGLTRAEEQLYVVGKEKIIDRYDFGCPNAVVEIADSAPEGVTPARFEEPYFMFVNGRYEDAKNALEKERKWLNKKIDEYFKGLYRLSYSDIKAIEDPYDFLMTRVLGIREDTDSTRRGQDFHKMVQPYLEGKIRPDQVPESLRSEFTNLDEAIGEIKGDYAIPPLYSELRIELPLAHLFPDSGAPEEFMIHGFLDAVFSDKERKKFMIVDYKTSKQIQSEYWQQLWLYSRMFKSYYNILPENISGGIFYLGLRGPIQTGEKLFEAQIREYSKIKTDVISNRIREILSYREDPEIFVQKLLETEPRTELGRRLQSALS